MDTTANSGRRRRRLGLLMALGATAGLLFASPVRAEEAKSESPSPDAKKDEVVLPWLSLPQISFRAKPIRPLQMHAAAGFSVTGFFFGAAAGYGF